MLGVADILLKISNCARKANCFTIWTDKKKIQNSKTSKQNIIIVKKKNIF